MSDFKNKLFFTVAQIDGQTKKFSLISDGGFFASLRP